MYGSHKKTNVTFRCLVIWRQIVDSARVEVYASTTYNYVKGLVVFCFVVVTWSVFSGYTTSAYSHSSSLFLALEQSYDHSSAGE